MNTTIEATPASRTDVRRHARHQVIGLSAQFLLGIGISLIGQPSETTGTAHTTSNVLLGLHVLVAVVLVGGAAGVIRAARGRGRQWRVAQGGAAAIVLTFAAGIATLITKSNWWSYAMAVGFLVSLLVYVSLLAQATSAQATSAQATSTAGRVPAGTATHPERATRPQ